MIRGQQYGGRYIPFIGRDFIRYLAYFRSDRCMIRPRSWAARTALFLIFTSCGALVSAQELSIVVDTANVRGQGTIDFKEFPLGLVSAVPSGVDSVSVETSAPRYRLWADLNSIVPGRFGTFSFDLYARDESAPNVGFHRFTITGTPVGGFVDSNDNISVHVLKGATDSKGVLAIPLHSGGQVDLLAIPVHNGGQVELLASDVPAPLRDVSLGQAKNIDFTFKNKLENLKLQITEITIESECPKCWKGNFNLAQTVQGDESTEIAIPTKLEPLAFPALGASALKLKSDQAHDTLTFNITYHAAFGGQPRKQRFTFPVRFTPSIWALLLAVFIGVVLGFLLSLLLDQERRASSQAALRAAGAALLLSVVVEILGLALASYGNKVVIFGFDLDPRQFLPALVIAILVSGGATVVSAIKKAFGGGT